MKIFIFKRIEQASSSYHPEGGLVVIAQDVEAAKELLKSDEDIFITEDEWMNVEQYDLLGNPEPKFWVMEDSGCC
jgi:hypothetical protein